MWGLPIKVCCLNHHSAGFRTLSEESHYIYAINVHYQHDIRSPLRREQKHDWRKLSTTKAQSTVFEEFGTSEVAISHIPQTTDSSSWANCTPRAIHERDVDCIIAAVTSTTMCEVIVVGLLKLRSTSQTRKVAISAIDGEGRPPLSVDLGYGRTHRFV